MTFLTLVCVNNDDNSSYVAEWKYFTSLRMFVTNIFVLYSCAY